MLSWLNNNVNVQNYTLKNGENDKCDYVYFTTISFLKKQSTLDGKCAAEK